MSTRLMTAILGLAALAVIVGAAAVGSGDVLERIVTPPALVRAAFVGVAVVGGLALGRASLGRFQTAGIERLDGIQRVAFEGADPIVLLRGIRLAFLSLAAFAAALGWLLASPLPLVVAGIIAAVDVLETSFLLLVASSRGG